MKLFLFLFLFVTNVFAGITDAKFSTAQIFDVQWNISGGKLNANGFNYIYSSINYATQTTQAARWTQAQTQDAGSNGRYIAFFNSTTHPGTYGMAVYNSNGTVYKLINNTGSFRTLADGAIFYNGNGMWGTLITTKQGYNYGQSGSFTITQEYPTNTQLQAYTPESSTPLAAGETAPPPAPPAPTYSASITTEQQNKINAARDRQTYKNEINIDQIGHYNNIDVIQSGHYHLVDINVIGNTNNIDVSQYGIKNYAKVQTTNGNNNSVNIFQHNTGGAQVLGHFSETLISGSNNTVTLNQTGDGEKRNFTNVSGDLNIINHLQNGTGTKYSDIKATGNGHSITLDQKDGGAHAARIEVTNNGGASTVNVLQQGNTNQTYSVQQLCATVSGCSVGIQQQ
jgi:hypothetical protein